MKNLVEAVSELDSSMCKMIQAGHFDQLSSSKNQPGHFKITWLTGSFLV